MSPSRFENRNKFYKALLAKSPIGEFGSDYQKESLLRSMDNAHRLLSSPAAKAFDLSLEPKESYDRYNTGRFGLGCLLARRLTEVGARFIEVTTEYEPKRHGFPVVISEMPPLPLECGLILGDVVHRAGKVLGASGRDGFAGRRQTA